MDLFQRLDEDISNLIIEHGFLNLDTLRFATEPEVERAAVRALEMATPDQQLAIAMRQSAMGIEGDDAIINEDENEANDDVANNNAGNVDSEDTGGYIGWEERNRLLTDTRNNSAETSDAEDDNTNTHDDRTECVVCFTARQPLHRLPCGCRMCPRCLRRCLRAGLRPGGWPPRCCQPLQPENVEQAAGEERPRLVRLYRQVRVEEETPGEERVYCARPECAAFIPTAGGATCLACGQGTCRQCRRPLHPGQLCGTEAEDAALMDVMDELHLSPCPSCRRIIERAGGCTHMTCVCGEEFCFSCGGIWIRGCVQNCRGGRVNMRDRRTTYRQGQLGEDGRLVVPTPVLQHPPFPPPPPPPPQPPQVQPEVQPQAQPFPQANLDGFWVPFPAGNPQPQMQGFQPVGEIPFIDHRNVYDMDREARIRQGRGRFSVIMYYPDGRNTEPETREWRPEPRADRRRPPPLARLGERAGAPRAWPVFTIHAEDPLCSHHLPTSWEVEDMNNRVQPPACTFCRSRAYAVYFRCRTCGIVACSMHNSVRFGLTWAQAVRVRNGLRNRVWIEPAGTRRGGENRRDENRRGVWEKMTRMDVPAARVE